MLAIGDPAVWVGVVSAHRDEAFRACRYVIDEVKHRPADLERKSIISRRQHRRMGELPAIRVRVTQTTGIRTTRWRSRKPIFFSTPARFRLPEVEKPRARRS